MGNLLQVHKSTGKSVGFPGGLVGGLRSHMPAEVILFFVFFSWVFVGHIMTQLLPKIFEKYCTWYLLGCNEGLMPVSKQSWTWR